MKVFMESKHIYIIWLSLFTTSLTPNLSNIRSKKNGFLLWILIFPLLFVFLHIPTDFIVNVLFSPDTRSKVSALQHPSSLSTVFGHQHNICTTFPFTNIFQSKVITWHKTQHCQIHRRCFKKWNYTDRWLCFPENTILPLLLRHWLELSNKDRVKCSVDMQSH